MQGMNSQHHESQSGQGSIAYELLLLQQRLDAYEQLHIEEMAELRQEIVRLRRAFLQETNPQMQILAPQPELHRE
jgi:predicted metal-dependent hydrolase